MSTATKERNAFFARPWKGPNREYDIFKEGFIALVVVGFLVVALSALFSSPDDPEITFKQWAQADSASFYQTVVTQLSGESETAGYGAPYNEGSDGLSVGPLTMQKWGGVTHPVDTAQDFVITPLTTSQPNVTTRAALIVWNNADPDQRVKWATDYNAALTDAEGDPTKVAAGDYGPVPTLAQSTTDLAVAGAYDNAMTGQGLFYQTDQTKQLLMMGDGGYMEGKAVELNLGGDTWGMVNEAGSWPGQVWLAPWDVWYQLPVFNAADEDTNSFNRTMTDNADAIITVIMVVFFLIVTLLPWIPGLRSIPKWIPLHRLVWKDYYRKYGRV